MSPKSAISAAISVDWEVPDPPVGNTDITGDLNGTTVTFSNAERSFIGGLNIFSDSDFSAAPPSSNEVVNYSLNSNWTATFSNPISNLLLYVVRWRGAATGVNTTTYTFNQSFTILSGLGEGTVSGNTLSFPEESGSNNGIIQFTGPVSSLSVSTNGINNSGNSLTFGVQSVQSIPEPLTILGAGTAISFGAFFKRKLNQKKNS
ncbi:MAG TPA: hypothetical protein DCF68_01970 [Cyanothece sp. UBA12306]|nr:hypothetical protein [Cyanothece sp. UBA12306]